MAYQEVLAAVEKLDLLAPSWGDTKAARCPAHDDNRASLSLSEGSDGRALVYCHAGCDIHDVVSALGITMDDLFRAGDRGDAAIVATYEYLDESNEPLYRVLRLSPKGFFQERWEDGEWKPTMRDVRKVLYHLPQLVRLDPDQTVYIVEGEKDADNLRDRLGVFATCLLGGAGKWLDDYLGYFEDRPVVVITDNDDPGTKHGDLLVEKLRGVARSVELRRPATGKDVTDHLLAGLGLDDLLEDGIATFEPWDPDTYEPEDEEWLWKPYVPRAGRILVYGASGSLKSLWAAWIGAHVAAEGGKVAYFSLEMPRRQYAQRFKQLKHIGFEKGSYQTFGAFMFGMNLETAIKSFQGYDLLIVDSWSQAQGEMGSNDNDAVSMMDAQFFQPLIAATGATVLVIDNTGKDGKDRDGEKVKNDEARGASRKKDIQEVAWWLHRPDAGNNFRTRIENRKMRLNEPAPAPITVETPQDRIEFYLVERGLRTDLPLWDGSRVSPLDSDGTQMEVSATRETALETTTETPTQTGPGPTTAPSAPDPAFSSEQEALEATIMALGSAAEKRAVRIAQGKRRLEALDDAVR